MVMIKETAKGIGYLIRSLKENSKTITRVAFWKIPHKNSGQEDICLKIGRYIKKGSYSKDLENINPKSELTLDNEEFQKLLEFLSENYAPFKNSAKRYILLDEKFDHEKIEHLKAIFADPDKEKVLNFIAKNNLLTEDIISGLQH